ncbi:MAG: type-F conjugative transfer system secretin TraK [Alphaproteobacteria bacterium]|nr:type-F conjugative transfer system secretin TraK [Alphaproteobacteria bacterium]
MPVSRQKTDFSNQKIGGEKMKYENNKIIKNETICLKVSCFLISLFCTVISGLCLLTFTLCCLPSGSQAAQIHPLNDLKVIEAPISQTGLTRITVKGDRIADVFGMSGEYVMEADETQGQVFIRPLEPALNPISLTVTTEGGHTQDLRLVPKNQAPEALILRAEQSPDAHKAEMSITRNEIEELLSAMSKGRIPMGYRSVALDLPSSHVPHKLIYEVNNNKLRGLTYEVKNLTPTPWVLVESGFAQKLNIDVLDIHVVAVLMPKKFLKPGESTHVYIAAKSL